MKFYQPTSATGDPQSDNEYASRHYVDTKMQSGIGSVVVGSLYITDVMPTSSGIVGQKIYDPNTVPANAVLTEATSDNSAIRVKVYAEGGNSFYSPTVTINGVTATLTKVSTDASRVFTGYADIVINGDTSVEAISSTGATASVLVHLAGAGPTVSSLVIGALPGSQTEVKAGDIVQVSGVVDNAATSVQILASGASSTISYMTLGAVGSAGSTQRTFSGTFAASSMSGAQSISAKAANALGTFGEVFTSLNTVQMNQTAPTIGTISIAYPNGQKALKQNDSAVISATVTNGDTVTYSSGSSLTVTNPTVYEQNKTVTSSSTGYSVGVYNYTIVAVKASNGASSSSSAAVALAGVAPTAVITGVSSRFTSSSTGNQYTITVTANQNLASAPSIDLPSGTWKTAWAGSGTTWSRTLQVLDTDQKGTFNFANVALTGLSGLVGSTITSGGSYTIGGFSTRTIIFPAFSQLAPIGTYVSTISKTTAKYTGAASNLTLQSTTNNVFQGYTIVNSDGTYNPNGNYLFLNDQAYAGSNTSGTLQVDIGEAA
jgi:hypothetical protein